MKKILSPRPLPAKLKRKKKQATLSACLGLPIGCMKFLFPEDFWCGLKPRAKNTLPICLLVQWVVAKAVV
jgi:hypothetical protein